MYFSSLIDTFTLFQTAACPPVLFYSVLHIDTVETISPSRRPLPVTESWPSLHKCITTSTRRTKWLGWATAQMVELEATPVLERRANLRWPSWCWCWCQFRSWCWSWWSWCWCRCWSWWWCWWWRNGGGNASAGEESKHDVETINAQFYLRLIRIMNDAVLDANKDNFAISKMTQSDLQGEEGEGDYTVYECPGLASTDEMEVKNPLFNDDPTPKNPWTITQLTEGIGNKSRPIRNPDETPRDLPVDQNPPIRDQNFIFRRKLISTEKYIGCYHQCKKYIFTFYWEQISIFDDMKVWPYALQYLSLGNQKDMNAIFGRVCFQWPEYVRGLGAGWSGHFGKYNLNICNLAFLIMRP